MAKEFTCIEACFHNNRLWEPGDVLVLEEGDTDKVPPHFTDDPSLLVAKEDKEYDFARQFDSSDIRRRNSNSTVSGVISGEGEPQTMSQMARARHGGASPVPQQGKK